MKTTFTPTNPKDRIEQIDILRGFALFGVLLVNVFGYNSSFFDFSGFYSQFTDSLNQTIFSLVVNYGADKFIGLFSILFGIGFSIMYSKQKENENAFLKLYFRRMLTLMGFGIIHIVFFWAGDILLIYALLGMILLLSRKINPQLLLIISVFMYFFPILYIALSVSFSFLPDALNSTSNFSSSLVKDIYSVGSFYEVFKLRLEEYFAFRYINLFYYVPKIISLFIFGYLFQSQNILTKINFSKSKYFILGIIFLIVGILLNTYTLNIVNSIVNTDTNPYYTTLYMGIFEITNVFLIFSYLLIILILSKTFILKTLLQPLKYVGRMSLTNYLTYSVVFTTIMYSYGFGMFGSFTPFELIIIAVIVFMVQIILCKMYLKRFRYGPLEFIWRKFTYLAL